MEEKISTILLDMEEYLSVHQLKKLQEVLLERLLADKSKESAADDDVLELFIAAKNIEGCSKRTLDFYRGTIKKLLDTIQKPVRQITTEDIRKYLADYQGVNNCSKTTIDNIRRNISSFFSWLEEEDYILKSPMKRIHKIRTTSSVKKTISDEDIEKIRDKCENIRDLAMVDLLYSSGMRVGELVKLNIEDLDFEERECIVFGKGGKKRKVYFDARTKLHLQKYLESRSDKNRALFVSLDQPHERLQISGVEIRIRNLGKAAGAERTHPHKFRRTMATRAIDKGMPIEQVQKILGHNQIDTTMHYAMVSENNVKNSHRKYIS